MRYISELYDYLVKSLKLDYSKGHYWVEQGGLKFGSGDENEAFQVDYVGHIAITGYKLPIDQLLYFLVQFLKKNQPLLAGSDEKPVFEYENLKRDEHNVYFSIPIQEIVKASAIAEGISLEAVDPPPAVEPWAMHTVTATAQHTPGGSSD